MFQVQFLAQASADLGRLDAAVIQRVLRKLRWLAENFESTKPEALTGSLGGLFKLRVGDYRIIYEADREHSLLTVHMVGHRREIYKEQ